MDDLDFAAFWQELLERQRAQRRRKRELELVLALFNRARSYVVQEGFILN